MRLWKSKLEAVIETAVPGMPLSGDRLTAGKGALNVAVAELMPSLAVIT